MNSSKALYKLSEDEVKMEIWLHLHWLEFFLNLFGFFTTTAFVIFFWKNMRSRIDNNVFVLLMHTMILLMISSMHSVVKSIVILIGPMVTSAGDIIMTSKTTGFCIDLL